MGEDEISECVLRLRDGDPQAAQKLWEAYFAKLARYAREKLGMIPRRAADEEDIALSAMNSFCQGMANGRFPDLEHRDELWRLLLTITARKARAEMRRHFTARRGSGRTRGESVFVRANAEKAREEGIEGVLGEEPTPELACMFAEECRRLLGTLEDLPLRQIAIYRLEGYSVPEIAERLGCARRTVERKLERIQKKWQGE